MNQTVFGTELVMLTFIFGVTQLLVLFIHLGVLITRPYNKSNWRFLLLTVTFIFYNACSGFLPDDTLSINLVLQNILAFGSGILLASYYFYFLVTEIEIEQSRFFNFCFLYYQVPLWSHTYSLTSLLVTF